MKLIVYMKYDNLYQFAGFLIQNSTNCAEM